MITWLQLEQPGYVVNNNTSNTIDANSYHLIFVIPNDIEMAVMYITYAYKIWSWHSFDNQGG